MHERSKQAEWSSVVRQLQYSCVLCVYFRESSNTLGTLGRIVGVSWRPYLPNTAPHGTFGLARLAGPLCGFAELCYGSSLAVPGGRQKTGRRFLLPTVNATHARPSYR